MTDMKLTSFEDLKQKIQHESLTRAEEKHTILTVSAGTCGRARGSLKVVEELERVIQEKKLKDRVSVKITGCHGFCEAEPNIIIQPQNLFYQNVQPSDAEAIIQETVLNDQIIDRFLYKEHDTGELKSSGPDIGFYKKQLRNVLGDNEQIEPTKIEDYFAVGGYSALAKV
ncbi:MAG: NAD(P)H-dependent oxidoreductase subunit E, partial [Candidatus Aminicenantaceae bacterium]